MVDFHSHIINDTDDGSKGFSESVALLYEAKKAGFDTVICTPHYMMGFYEKDVKYVSDRIKDLQIDSRRVGVNLYQANEIYAHEDICKFISEKKATTINNSKYLLMEFPLTDEPMLNSIDIIKDIVKNGYVPIVAHPERYPYVQKKLKFAEDLVENGALLQMNYASIDGFYGLRAKKTAIKLLKKKMISFLGTDTHRQKTMYTKTQKYIDHILRYVSDEEFDNISNANALKVLHNEEI
mgnify:FL=1